MDQSIGTQTLRPITTSVGNNARCQAESTLTYLFEQNLSGMPSLILLEMINHPVVALPFHFCYIYMRDHQVVKQGIGAWPCDSTCRFLHDLFFDYPRVSLLILSSQLILGVDFSG